MDLSPPQVIKRYRIKEIQSSTEFPKHVGQVGGVLPGTSKIKVMKLILCLNSETKQSTCKVQ
jgi:hypothetical protein